MQRKIRLSAMALMLSTGCLRLGAAVVNISTGFYFYSPNSVTVNAGDTIHWQTLNGHSATETNNPPSSATYNGTGFRSPLGTASTFDWVATAGPHNYFCEVHGGNLMYGYIYVLDPTATPTSTET